MRRTFRSTKSKAESHARKVRGHVYGSSLNDPKGWLEGAGKFVRHTKVRGPSEIDERAFTAGAWMLIIAAPGAK